MAVENEHEELVAELPKLEQLSAEERLKAAKKRRASQLERWNVRVQTEGLFPPIIKANKGKQLKFDDTITLIESSARDDAEEVLVLLKNGMSPDLQNLDGLSALHQAVIEDCVDVVHVLVENAAALDIKDADLWTPLHAAVACGNFEIVKFLVEHGADMVAINADGNMPIDLVDENEDIEMYLDKMMTEKGYTEEQLESIRNAVADRMMIDLRDSVQKGRDLDVKDDTGATAMHVAAANGYLDVMEFLLDNGALVDVQDRDGWQPIHAAVCWGQDAAIEMLFNHGADLDAKTNNNERPSDLTEDEELLEILTELKESGRKLVKSVKRSQSNSSRSLCVRRLSLVDKHQTSKNDALSEGIFFQKPEVISVMITAGEAEDDDEQKRNSLKRENHEALQYKNLDPQITHHTSSFSTKETVISQDRESDVQNQLTKTPQGVTSVEKTNKHDQEGNASVESVHVSITENKNKDDGLREPQLVSYKKITCPSLGITTAPVAQPEIDSPLPRNITEGDAYEDESKSDPTLDIEARKKNTADQSRNGKLSAKSEASVNKKCCCIL